MYVFRRNEENIQKYVVRIGYRRRRLSFFIALYTKMVTSERYDMFITFTALLRSKPEVTIMLTDEKDNPLE